MIKISKRERDYLEKNGCKWGTDLHKTYSDGKTYYASETKKVKELLTKYNRSITLESH